MVFSLGPVPETTRNLQPDLSGFKEKTRNEFAAFWYQHSFIHPNCDTIWGETTGSIYALAGNSFIIINQTHKE